jgi:hypothetical protein
MTNKNTLDKPICFKISATNKENQSISKGKHLFNLSEHLDKKDYMMSVDFEGCCKMDFKLSATPGSKAVPAGGNPILKSHSDHHESTSSGFDLNVYKSISVVS